MSHDVHAAVLRPQCIQNKDIGEGKLGGMYPFVIMPDPHGYIIQLLGSTETAAITNEYEEMLVRLCKIKEVWCLSKEKGQY
jgi:hypothetical protein